MAVVHLTWCVCCSAAAARRQGKFAEEIVPIKTQVTDKEGNTKEVTVSDRTDADILWKCNFTSEHVSFCRKSSVYMMVQNEL